MKGTSFNLSAWAAGTVSGESTLRINRQTPLRPKTWFWLTNTRGRFHSLAYMNMRLILSRVLHRYDIKLADEAQDWIAEQKIFTIWEKIPLMVLVTPAQVVPRAPDPDETEKQAGS